MARKTCTPFCDTKKTCPKHHDLLLTLINCSDRKNQEANAYFEEFQTTVKAYLKKGWNVNDAIPDPVRNYRFPLVHWAGVMGKSRALEWMINFGFNVTVRTSGSQETALHRSVLCLSYSDRRHSIDKIKRLVHLLKDCLPLQDKAMQTPLHAASIKLITDTARNDFYSEFVMAMVAKAMEIPEKTTDILNAKDNQGNTALHYLAQNDNFGFVPLCSIINAGGDVSILNKKKLRPLDLAMNKGCTSIIKTLNSHGKTSNLSCDDNIVYSADSPPASPVNQSSENNQHNVLNSSEVESQADHDGTHSNNTDTPSLECNEDHSSTSISEDVSLGEPTCAMNEVSSAIAASDPDPGSTADDAAAAATDLNNDVPQTACPEISCENRGDSPATLDALSVNTDEAGSSCEASGNNTEEECRCTTIGVQTPRLSQYSCIVHIKQEQLSPCERCQQESMGEISSSSEMQSFATTEMANSVITLLRGAGLLDNLTEIAEKRRIEDEYVLTEKLERVKETNNELESSIHEIEEKESMIEKLSTELEELKKQVQTKADEREKLLRKRKSLNEECNSLQKKLHYCDSLLKFVPKENSDS